jgi:hypothetical protein
LQGTLRSLRGEFFNTTSQPAKVVSMKGWLRGAVAVAAVLIAVVFIWQFMQPDLFEKYAEIKMITQAERGAPEDEQLMNGVTAFNAKDYTWAAEILAQVSQKDTANSFVSFYYGVSLLQTNRITEARTIFVQLYAGQSAFKYEAAFYQALTFLKEENKAVCKEWLLKIPADALNYSKTQELLKKL